MARLPRAEVFSPDEIAICHVINRTVRRCFLMGEDPVTGKNYDHRKGWIEQQLKLLAESFGIDLLGFAILSNHFHLILRSRPDVVASWDDTEVARRWLMLCPHRRTDEGLAEEPSEPELNSIRHDAERLQEIRSRLSDISWWMRLLSQNIAMRANREDEESGKFWQSRFRAVRLLDESSLLACAAYVDLNPIRAAMAETLEASDYTSAQRRIQDLTGQDQAKPEAAAAASESIGEEGERRVESASPASFLSPVEIDERKDATGACPSGEGFRCSDKGFLAMSVAEYLELLDWTARELRPGRRGSTPTSLPPILDRLQISASTWCELVDNFGRLFGIVAGTPRTVEGTRSRIGRRRFRLTARVRELMATAG